MQVFNYQGWKITTTIIIIMTLPLSTAFELSNTFSWREQYRLRVANSTECRPSNGLKSHLAATCTISNMYNTHNSWQKSKQANEQCVQHWTYIHTYIHTPILRPSWLCLGFHGWGGTRTNLDFTEARNNEWQWHQMDHTQICTSPQTDNLPSNPPLSFLQAGCPSCCSTNSIKALIRTKIWTAFFPGQPE